MVLLFWCRLTQVVLEKRPLNERSSSYGHSVVSERRVETRRRTAAGVSEVSDCHSWLLQFIAHNASAAVADSTLLRIRLLALSTQHSATRVNKIISRCHSVVSSCPRDGAWLSKR